MATRQQFGAPVLAPDLQRKQFELQRNQLMAQQLMQGEMPQGQMVGNQYVPPNITQQLAAALRPVVGQQVMNRIPQQMADLYQAQQAHDLQKFNALFGGGASGAGAGSTVGMQINPDAPASGDPRREFMLAQLMGMDKYAAERMKWNAPTNEQKNLAHLPAQNRDALIQAAFLNEAGKDGMQMMMGPDGRVRALPVAGFGDIQADNAGAVAAAQAQAQANMDLVQVPDGRGGTVMMPRSQAVQSLGGSPSGIPTQQTQAAPPATSRFGRAPSSGEQAYDAETGKRFANQYQTLQTGASNARDMLGMYDLAEQALNSGVRTGIGAEAELTLRQLGSAMGLDTNPEKVSGGELIRAVQNRMALIMRNPDGGMGMPGAISDRDIKFLKDSQVGIDRTPEGNRQMLQAFRAIEQRKVQMAELADQYVQQHGRLDAGFNRVVRDFAESNPLFAPTEPDARVQKLDEILGF